MGIKLSKFKFEFPWELLAQYPPKNRDESKMMVVHRDTGKIEHKIFKDILEYFESGDIFVVNDTKVFRARLFGYKEKTGAKIEVFLLRELNKDVHLWDVMVDPARKIRVGNKLFFGENELVAEVIDNTTSRGRTIRFLDFDKNDEFYNLIYKFGKTPLPKYINREPEPEDEKRYQTIFAKNIGAVAAPTAGLHFTPVIVKRMEIKGIKIAPITLHVGLGTFRQVEVEDLSKHSMDSEHIIISQQTCDIVNHAKESGKKIVSVGTTSMRTLESAIAVDRSLKPTDSWTDKFIFPPYEFNIINSLVTNFHLPGSTLLMMTCAFGGFDLIMKAYKVAIKNKYRFFSYGDVMLVI